MLEAAGWQIQNRVGHDPDVALSVAVREYPLKGALLAELRGSKMNKKDQIAFNRKDTDPLLDLVGTLECDVTNIKKHDNASVRPKIRLELLRQGDISAGRAARLLNISRWDLSELMYEAGISPFDENSTVEMLEAEVKSALKDLDGSNP